MTWKPKLLSRLWDHQKQMLHFLQDNKTVLLAADKGTGKTFPVIHAVVDDMSLNPDHYSVCLVLAPRMACRVWENEIYLHTQGVNALSITSLSGNTAKKARTIRKFYWASECPAFIIINYDVVWRPAIQDLLFKLPVKYMVCDESHRIKSHNSKTSKQVAKLARYYGSNLLYRVCMTATPVPNGREDIFGQARFLNPDIFGTRWGAFLDKYTRRIPIPGVRGAWKIVGYRNQQSFEGLLKNVVLHMKLEDINLSLPDKMHVLLTTHMSAKWRRLYKEMVQESVAEVDGELLLADNALTKCTRLHQITGRSKLTDLLELIVDMPTGEPVVVFYQYRKDGENIGVYLGQAGYDVGYINADHNDMQAWKDGEYQVLAVQYQSGAESIDLTRARICVFYSLTWNAALYDQALGRVYRATQERNVVWYYLLADQTIDTDIFGALQSKQDVAQCLLNKYDTGE